MNKLLLRHPLSTKKQLLLFVTIVAMTLQLSGQITLTSADCTLSPPDTVIRKQILNPATVADPTEGDNQYWDYSDIAVDPGAETHATAYAPVTANAVFPTATASSPVLFPTLPGLAVPRLNYHICQSRVKTN